MSQKLLLRSFVFSFIVNIASIYVLFRYKGYSSLIFSDWDEPYYLPLAIEKGYLFLNNGLHWSDIAYPHDLLNILIGAIAVIFNMTSSTLGVASDFICCFLAYVLLASFFHVLSGKESYANEAAALVVCLFPWLFPISSSFPSQPIFRSLNTQYSFLGFVLALLIFVKGIRAYRYTNRWAFLTGSIGGGLLYIYVFAWGSFFTTILCFMAFELVLFREKESKYIIKRACIILFSGFLVSIPGIYFIFWQHFLSNGHIQEHVNEIRSFFDIETFYFPPLLDTSLAVFLTFFLFSSYSKNEFSEKDKQGIIFMCMIILSLLCAQFFLMNTQPLLKVRIEPYHFGLFFLYPMVSGVFVLLILCSDSLKRNTLYLFYLVLIVAGLLSTSVSLWKVSHPVTIELEKTELFKFLDQNIPKNSVITSLPFLTDELRSDISPYLLLMPNWIKALGRQRIFAEFIGAEPYPDIFVKEELTISWLFRGQIDMLVPCNESKQLNLAKDILYGTTTFSDIARIQSCEKAKSIKSLITPCQMLNEFKIDYVLDEANTRLSNQQLPLYLLREVWNSSLNTYRLYKFDQDAAILRFCKDT